MYAKVVCTQVVEIKDVVVKEHRRFQDLLKIEGEHVNAIFTPVPDSSNSSFFPPAVDSPPFVFRFCFITSFRELLMFIALFLLFLSLDFGFCRLNGYRQFFASGASVAPWPAKPKVELFVEDPCIQVKADFGFERLCRVL